MRTKTGDLPISVDELRAFVRMDSTHEDAVLKQCIESGVDYVERETERDIIAGDVVEHVEAIHVAGNCITLQRSPTLALSSIEADGVEIADGFTFRGNCHRRSRIVFKSIPAGEIVVRYQTGMPGDATARQACLWAASHHFCNREPEIVGASVSQFEAGLKRILKLLGAGSYA